MDVSIDLVGSKEFCEMILKEVAKKATEFGAKTLSVECVGKARGFYEALGFIYIKPSFLGKLNLMYKCL